MNGKGRYLSRFVRSALRLAVLPQNCSRSPLGNARISFAGPSRNRLWSLLEKRTILASPERPGTLRTLPVGCHTNKSGPPMPSESGRRQRPKEAVVLRNGHSCLRKSGWLALESVAWSGGPFEGTVIALPHLGHFELLPAFSSFETRGRPHEGQIKRIVIEVTPTRLVLSEPEIITLAGRKCQPTLLVSPAGGSSTVQIDCL